MKRIDLHIHTNKSDGELTPIEMIDESVKNGVNLISITDHDTVEAYSEEFLDYAKENNIEVIKGVEISTKLGKTGIHILGYNIDITNENLINKLQILRNTRHDYLYNVAKKLKELGYTLNVLELDKIEAVTKSHIALDVLANPNNEPELTMNFGSIPSMGMFIETIMNEGCPAFVKKESITPMEAAALIRGAGGKVVMAHPVCYKYEDNLKMEAVVELIKNIDVDGIEANYIYLDKDENKINEIEQWNNVAKDLELFTTIGSDFHKKDRIHPVIGLLNENISLDLTTIENIVENLK